MSEFTETIWDDPNLKIVIDKILQNKKDLSKFENEMFQLAIISGKLDEIRLSIQRRPDKGANSNLNAQH